MVKPRTFVRFIVAAEITRWTSYEEMRGDTSSIYIMESRAPCMLDPPTDSLSTEMHRKTQWWQDKVKSQSCIHSAPCLPSDKAQLGIWFTPFIFSTLHFLPPDTAPSVKFSWSDNTEALVVHPHKRYPVAIYKQLILLCPAEKHVPRGNVSFRQNTSQSSNTISKISSL